MDVIHLIGDEELRSHSMLSWPPALNLEPDLYLVK